jgi:hypothetical protein
MSEEERRAGTIRLRVDEDQLEVAIRPTDRD